MIIKKTVRFIAYAAIFLIPLFAVLAPYSWGGASSTFPSTADYFFPFITGKAFFFRILVEIAFAAWAILAFMDKRYRPRITKLTLAITLFAVVTLIADLLGVNPLKSLWSNFERMEGWLVIVHLWAFFMVTTSLFGPGPEGRRTWYKWINVELAVAVIVGIYGVVQLMGGAAIHQGSSRIDASLGNAAYLAVYMLWNAGFAAYMFTVARKKILTNSQVMQWVYPILAAFFSFLLLATATRGTIIGLAGGVTIACLLYAIFGKKEAPLKRGIAGGLIVVVALLAVTVFAAKNAEFVKENTVLSRVSTISLSEFKTQARAYIWPMAIEGWQERPVLGWGQENFNYIFNANYEPKLYNQEQWFDRAHSVYLDWLVASGIVGLLVYLSFYFLFLYTLWKSDLSIAAKSILTGLLAGYAVHNLFVFDNIASYLLFFAALAFVNSFAPGKKISEKEVSSEAVEYIVAPVAVLAVIFVIYFFNVRYMQANKNLILGLTSCNGQQPNIEYFKKALDINVFGANQEIREHLLTCVTTVVNRPELPTQTKADFYDMAVAEINKQIESAERQDARIYALGGTFYDNLGRTTEAQKLLEKAHELSPRKQTISMQLAISYINSGQLEKAVALSEQAYTDEPNNEQAALTYALTLIVNGQDAKAREIFVNKPQLFETQQVGQAYLIVKDYEKAITVFDKLYSSDLKNDSYGVQLAQAYYAAGRTSMAIATLRKLAENRPDLKTQIEDTIKQVQP